MKAFILLTCTFFGFILNSPAQEENYKAFSPISEMDTVQYLEGQMWPKEVESPYDRFPARAKKSVREVVWNLSKNTAGMQFRFRSNAQQIVVKYAVGGNIQMPHMPATGVSGVDLYAKDLNGKWIWCKGNYSFKDTIQYVFDIAADNQDKPLEFTLYLPLYNSVRWMTVEVPDSSIFKALPARQEKPIVVYGTSIAQGGCASRPGLAWTNILSRKLDRPVVNLAFSGNGQLEPEVTSLIAEIPARLFVLDCMPNLTREQLFPDDTIRNRIDNTVAQLRKDHPNTPILLVDHDGYTDGESNRIRKELYERVNRVQGQVYDSLTTQASLKQLFYLDRESIGQDIESTVDGTHPNDIGMMHYADAYAAKLKEIFNEEGATTYITTPTTQYRDAPLYFWTDRHEAALKLNQRYQPKLVFIGNSITHFWGGQPSGPNRGQDSWEKYFGKEQPLNLGFGWDKIENVLWRIYHDELLGIAPEHIVLMIGVNNLGGSTDKEIKQGLEHLLKAIRNRQPEAQLLLMGILPCRGRETRVAQLNQEYEHLAQKLDISYADAGQLFLQADKKIKEELFSDGLHPNAEGYDLLGRFMSNQLKK